VPALLRVPGLRRRPELAPGAGRAQPLPLRDTGRDDGRRERARPVPVRSHRSARLRKARRAGDVAHVPLRAPVHRPGPRHPRSAHGDARDRAGADLLRREMASPPAAPAGVSLLRVLRLLAALTAALALAAPVRAEELPACALEDRPALVTSYDDHAITVLDTVFALPSDYAPTDLVRVSTAFPSSYDGGGQLLVRSVIIDDLAALLR